MKRNGFVRRIVVGLLLVVAFLALVTGVLAQESGDLDTGFDATNVAIGDVLLLPLIIGLIQFVKRFFARAPGNVWLFASFVLGITGQTVVFMVANETAVGSWDFGTWSMVVVYGLALGLAASKMYDELLASRWS